MRRFCRFPGLPIDPGLAGKFRSSCQPRTGGKQNVRYTSFLYPGCRIYLITEGSRGQCRKYPGKNAGRRPLGGSKDSSGTPGGGGRRPEAQTDPAPCDGKARRSHEHGHGKQQTLAASQRLPIICCSSAADSQRHATQNDQFGILRIAAQNARDWPCRSFRWHYAREVPGDPLPVRVSV